MYKALFVSAGFALLLGTPAFAMTPQAAVSHADKSQTATDVGADSHKPMRRHRHHAAMNASLRGGGEINALNALEAAGYRQFNDLHAQGSDFIATATRGGKSYDVTVSRSGNIQARNA